MERRRRDDAPAVPRPEKPVGGTRPRRVLVARDRAPDLEVLARSERPRLSALEEKEVPSRVGLHRRRLEEAAEGDPGAVGREGGAGHRSGDVHHRLDLSSPGRYPVEVRVLRRVVGLLDPVGGEVDPGAVRTPDELSLVERARGQLARFGGALPGDRRDRPHVIVALRIEPSLAVGAVDRASDDAHVALLRPFDLLSRGLSLLLTPLLVDVGCGRVTREGERPAIGGPERRGGSMRHLRQPARLAAFHGEQVDLRLLLLAGGAEERDGP